MSGAVIGLMASGRVPAVIPVGPMWSGDVVVNTGTTSVSDPSMCNIWYRRTIISWVYSSAEIAAAFPGRLSVVISGLRFTVSDQPVNQPLPQYAIGMKLTSATISQNPDTSPGSYTIVKPASNETFATGFVKEWPVFPTTFTWTFGNNLAITCAWGQCPTGFDGSGRQPYTSTGTRWFDRRDDTGDYVINVDSATTSSGGRPVVQLYCN